MEQLVLLLVIGLISLINWLMQRSAELREKRKLERSAQQDEPATVSSPDPPAREEEDPTASMRKLMEALGLPVEEAPPPVISKEPKPVAPPPPLPLPTFTPPKTPHAPKTRADSTPADKTAPSKRRVFRELLASPRGLQDAIILSEILGPPRGAK